MDRVPVKKILQFIKDGPLVQTWQLSDEFGYTLHFSNNKMFRLHQRGLVTNSIRGKWNLTNEGERRLEYYNAKDKKGVGKRE